MKYRALIVDDEPLAREKIRSLLEADAEVEIVGECGDGRAAARAIVEQDPDVVFLDVQMPEMDGFDVLEQVGSRRSPAIVFVTAYDEYALRAFDVHALDYLLKPFDRERFGAALARAKRQLESERAGALQERIAALLETLEGREGPDFLTRMVVKEGGRVYFVPVDDIDWIEAAGNYVELHVGNSSHLVRGTMKGLTEKLDPDRFLRVHRSAIVNLDRIREIQPWFKGEHLIVLESGEQIRTGAAYRDGLQKLLEDSR